MSGSEIKGSLLDRVLAVLNRPESDDVAAVREALAKRRVTLDQVRDAVKAVVRANIEMAQDAEKPSRRDDRP